jgi:hypothetical protein
MVSSLNYVPMDFKERYYITRVSTVVVVKSSDVSVCPETIKTLKDLKIEELFQNCCLCVGIGPVG